MYADLGSLLLKNLIVFLSASSQHVFPFYCGKTKILNLNLIYMKDMKDF